MGFVWVSEKAHTLGIIPSTPIPEPEARELSPASFYQSLLSLLPNVIRCFGTNGYFINSLSTIISLSNSTVSSGVFGFMNMYFKLCFSRFILYLSPIPFKLLVVQIIAYKVGWHHRHLNRSALSLLTLHPNTVMFAATYLL